jgi:hypothetical protein
VRTVTLATEALVREGYLRPEDGAAMIAQAQASDVLR